MWSLLAGNSDKVLESINGITLSGDDIAKFGDNVGDYSRQHRDIEIARQYGFRERPVIGVHSAAIGGRLSRDLMSVMQTPDKEYFYVRQNVTFRDPIYPDEPINWDPPKSEVEDEIIRYLLEVPAEDRERKPRVEMVSEFSTAYPVFNTEGLGRLVFSEETEFTHKKIKRFYECLREPPSKSVAFSHGIAVAPSALLSLAARLNKHYNTQIGGRNIEMQSQAYAPLEIGKARIDVHEAEKKGRGNKVFYTFDCILYQDGTPRISSRIRTLTNGEFPNLIISAEPDVISQSNQLSI